MTGIHKNLKPAIPMKKHTLTLVLFCACYALAYAGPEPLPSSKEVIQPLAPPPPSCFDGWYAGVHGSGLLRGDIDTTAHVFVINPGDVVFPDSDVHHGGDEFGGMGGLQLGRNFQRGNWVFGLEVDISVGEFDVDEGHAFAEVHAPRDIVSDTRSRTTLNWFSTVRPRVGYTFGQRFLIFVTGGLMVGSADTRVTSDLDIDLRQGTTPFSVQVTGVTDDRIEVGWTAGGGFDFCLAEHWILNFTYLYGDLGDQHAHNFFTAAAPNPGFTVNAEDRVDTDLQFHVFQGGLSYKF